MKKKTTNESAMTGNKIAEDPLIFYFSSKSGRANGLPPAENSKTNKDSNYKIQGV